MKRVIPQEMVTVMNWLLAHKKFEKYNFMSQIKDKMENGQKITIEESKVLRSILSSYTFENDFNEKNIADLLRKRGVI